MGLRKFVSNVFRKSATKRKHQRPFASNHFVDSIESLESRLVLFVATGNAWPNPQVITLSFEPDGTNLGGVNSNLNQAFNKNSNLNGRWQSEIIRAAQSWASVTNINFVVVTDSGAASGSGKYQQGDSTMGDIRVGGYDFGNSSLARAYMPPTDNNYSVAGDIVFNTGVAYGIGQGFDLYTVALHEIGHTLGLDHTSTTSSAALWSSYNGIKTTLQPDDISGIRSIYSGSSGRSADSYDASGSNNSIATADDITDELSKTQASAVVTGLDITTSTDTDFYTFEVPRWADSSIDVTVQSTGLSLLSPKLTVYAADKKTVLGTVSGAGKYGTTLTVTLNNVSKNQDFYVKVEGADSSVFNVGSYALIVDMGARTAPRAPTPTNTVANGSTLSGKGGAAEASGSNDVLLSPDPVIQTISPDTGASSMDRTTSSSQITLAGVAGLLESVEIYQDGVYVGKTTSLLGAWSFTLPNSLSEGNHDFYVMTKGVLGLLGYTGTSDLFTVTIDTTPPNAPTLASITPQPGSNGLLTAAPESLSGTAAPSNIINVLANGAVIGTTQADGQGNWTYQFDAALPDGTYQIAVTGSDAAGNASAPSAAQTVTIDTGVAVPTLTGINSDTGVSNSDEITRTRNLVINGLGEAGSTITVMRDGLIVGSTVAKSNGTWAFDYTSVSLADGSYDFSALATDAVGHVSSWSSAMTVVVDTSIGAPGVSSVTKTSLLLSLATTVSLQGYADANTTVQLYVNGNWQASIAADDQGVWAYQYSSLLGTSATLHFSVSASDVAGNQSATVSNYDLVSGSSAPTVSNITLNSSSTNTSSGLVVNTTTPAISGTASKASVVNIYDNNRLIGTAVVAATGKWTFTAPSLSKGRHSLVAVATAADGISKGTASAALVFQV